MRLSPDKGYFVGRFSLEYYKKVALLVDFHLQGQLLSKKLLRSGAIVSVMTLISRVLGLIRDVVMAGLLGANANADVYYLAVKIPNFMRRLFAEGAFAQAFVPVLSEYQAQDDKDKIRELIAYASGTRGTIITVVAIVGVIGSPVLIALFGAGWFVDSFSDPEAQHK